jgi:hypothetical protein
MIYWQSYRLSPIKAGGAEVGAGIRREGLSHCQQVKKQGQRGLVPLSSSPPTVRFVIVMETRFSQVFFSSPLRGLASPVPVPDISDSTQGCHPLPVSRRASPSALPPRGSHSPGIRAFFFPFSPSESFHSLAGMSGAVIIA